jgi:ribosomal subunit interface protein
MRISFKHMDSSEAARDYAETKLLPVLDRFLKADIDAHLTLSVEHKEHIADINLQGGRSFHLHLHATASHMNPAIDKLHDILENKLRNLKNKIRHKKGDDSIRLHEEEPVTSDEEMLDAEDVIKFDQAIKAKRSKT